MKIRARPFDIVAILVSLAVLLVFIVLGRGSEADGYLVINDAQGELLYPLDENREIDIRGPVGISTIVIENGKAGFVHSDCSDKLCLAMGMVGHSHEWAACLPNRVMLSFTARAADRTRFGD